MAPIDEIFREIDDFCKAFLPQFEPGLVRSHNANAIAGNVIGAAI